MSSDRPRVFFLNHNLAATNNGTPSLPLLSESINGNAGNSYIGWSISKALQIRPIDIQGVGNIWKTKFPLPNPEAVNSDFDHVVLALQDQLRESCSILNYERLTAFLERITIPISVFSLGANATSGTAADLSSRLGEDQIRFYRTISTKCHSLGIRGEFTASVLEKLGIRNTTIHGCPTYFETGRGRSLKWKSRTDSGPILTNGYYWRSRNERRRVHHILQCFETEKELITFLFSNSDETKPLITSLRGKHAGYAQALFKALLKGRTHFFSNIDAWKYFFLSNGFSLSVGTRVHGSIIAMNSGVPSLVTSEDYRAKEMAEFLGIPFDPSIRPETKIEEIQSKINLDQVNSRYLKAFETYCNWFRAEFSFEPDFTTETRNAGAELNSRGESSLGSQLVNALPEVDFIPRLEKYNIRLSHNLTRFSRTLGL